jgi:hypothetical protein
LGRDVEVDCDLDSTVPLVLKLFGGATFFFMQGLLYLIGLEGERTLMSSSVEEVSGRLCRSTRKSMMFVFTIEEKEEEN